jgi:hypothetical protein
MAKFKVAVSWEMCGEVTIDAPTLEAAIFRVENDLDMPLPDGEYVDASWRVDQDISEEIN